MIPYSRQVIDDSDIKAVTDALRSDWLTTGPQVASFEEAFAKTVGSLHAVAVSSGTAALHAAVFALGLKRGDEVIVPAMSFAATANCVVYQHARPVFADVDPDTLLIDPVSVRRRISRRTRAIICMDYAGQPCQYDRLREIAASRRLALVDDACHALGARYRGSSIGSLADLTVFSFHAVKHIATGEGGMITTDDAGRAQRMRAFRNHGITTDHHQREALGSWYYEMVDLGYNYRLTDFQCALGASQLMKLPANISRRREIAARYDRAFAGIPAYRPLVATADIEHAYHLYVVRLDTGKLGIDRKEVFRLLRAKGIGVNVHYIPIHLHPFYRKAFKTRPGMCPAAEAAYERIISLPMYHGLSDEDVDTVIGILREIAGGTAG